jgi:hypothetical protein
MANQKKGNLFFVDDASSEVECSDNKTQVVGVILSRGTAASNPILILSNNKASPDDMIKFQLETGVNTQHFDFSFHPLSFPDGLCVPASGLTTNANATIIFSINERK